MSGSRKKTPKGGITNAKSEKADKRAANRKIRRHVKEQLTLNPDREVLPHERELSNVWSMAKDGKRYLDPENDPEEMRK